MIGYVWANEPTSNSYTPSTIYSYNRSGGDIQITKSATGAYSVRFAGLGGGAQAGGNVQVTAYGQGNESCKVAGWASGGPDFTVLVRCFTGGGSPVDTRYTVLVTWP